jgi:hypothetical protein
VSGHVQVRVTRDPGTPQTAVVLGVFFDPAPAGAAVVPLAAGSAATTGGAAAASPQVSAGNAVTLPGFGLLGGVDAALLDWLFGHGRRLHDPDYGA